ncbi:MAG: signal peptide peptidase SppA [bacterium]|nr:signal peptide peptidase SppA [Candidatus Kapabacteria bacterium]
MSFIKVFFASVLGFFSSIVLVVLLSFGVIAAIIASVDSEEAPRVRTNSVLVIDLSKSYPEYNSTEGFAEITGGGDVTLRELAASVRAAATDERIAGIRLKSTGSPGTWASAEEIRRALEAFRQSGKFVIATIGDHGVAEGSYYVASAAETIIAVPGSQVELNGIAAVLPFFKTALDRLGIQAQIVRAGSFKSAVEPFILDSASAETKMMTREIVDGTFSMFRATVAKARKISPTTLQQMLSTRGFLSAEEARQAKLIDAVMYEDQIDSVLRARADVGIDSDVHTISIGEYKRVAEVGESERGGENQIAVVYAVGEIAPGKSGRGNNPLSGGEKLGSTTFSDAMRTARKSKSVKAVVVRISSPGGEAGPSEAMWREIKLTAAEKPVIASMGSVAASGGYFLAAACDTIVAEATSITGSIGVFGMWFTTREMMTEKLGINLQVIRSDSLADMLSMMRAPTDLERSIVQRSVDSTYQKFLRIVSEGRGISMANADALGQGRVYTGTRAKQLNLVDEIGGLDRAVEIAASQAGLGDDSYHVRVLPEARSFIDVLTEMFDETSLAASIRSFFGSPTDVAAAVIAELSKRSGVQMLAPTFQIDVN